MTLFRQYHLQNREIEKYARDLLATAENDKKSYDSALGLSSAIESLYKQRNDTEKAEQICEEHQQYFPLPFISEKNSIQTYLAMSDMSMLQKNYGCALDLLQEALLRTESEKNIAAAAVVYSEIGSVFFRTGDDVQAIANYQKALAMMEKTLDSQHPSIAVAYNNTALVYYERCEYGKALMFEQKALAIIGKVFGMDHPSTAVVYDNLALICKAMGDDAKAMEYDQAVLMIRKKLAETSSSHSE